MKTAPYEIEETPTFLQDMEKYKKAGQKKTLLKVFELLEDAIISPKSGKGHPEALKGYGEQHIFSRRIDKKNRLVYQILEEDRKIKLLSAWGHYDDK